MRELWEGYTIPGKEISNGWILTFTGKRIHPLHMTVDEICLADIAHALAMKCRYTGQCREFYSVAQHSVLMAHRDLPGTAMWRLMHDASEAYLPDIASPIKHQFPILREAEDRILECVRDKFHLPEFDHDEVKKADTAMLIWEGRRLFARDDQCHWWKCEDVMSEDMTPWDPIDAENEFLWMARHLGIQDDSTI